MFYNQVSLSVLKDMVFQTHIQKLSTKKTSKLYFKSISSLIKNIVNSESMQVKNSPQWKIKSKVMIDFRMVNLLNKTSYFTKNISLLHKFAFSSSIMIFRHPQKFQTLIQHLILSLSLSYYHITNISIYHITFFLQMYTSIGVSINHVSFDPIHPTPNLQDHTIMHEGNLKS